MNEKLEHVAAVIAAEIMELTADQRKTFKFPDDANGDTCDRARGTARAAVKVLMDSYDRYGDPDNFIDVMEEILR